MDFLKRFSSTTTLIGFLFFSTASSGCVAQSASAQRGSGTTQQPQATAQQGSGTQNAGGSQTTAASHPALTDPSLANKKAPEKFQAKFATTKGDIVVEVTRAWSPNGADRFYNMVDVGYFDDIAIFRAVPNFMFQFGVHGDPNISKHWKNATIKDDPPGQASNLPGYLTFAKTGAPNSRSAQMFINLGNNSFLDQQGFTPFGKVVQGLDIVAKINTEYGENKPQDNVQGRLVQEGNDWLLEKFPRLDLIKSVELIEMR